MAARRLRISASNLRLSDAERERALAALKAHYAEGRLSTAELETRVEDVYRARTHRDALVGLRDLAVRGVRGLIAGRVQRVQRAVMRMHLVTYAAANASMIGIWELTGQGVFWPAWILLPSSALLLGHAWASRKLTRALSRLRW
jgi:hypothetical protein